MMRTHHELVTLWTVRVALAFYVVALAAWVAQRPRSARVFWTLSFLSYIGHVLSAFTFQYHWSHNLAYAQTARETDDFDTLNWPTLIV